MEVHIGPEDLRAALHDDARLGLTAPDKWLPPVWFYDDRGSKLFDDITRLDEYYPTRAERLLLDVHAAEIADRTQADTLVELGAGTCDKSRILLAALVGAGTLGRYVPLDVSNTTLWEAAGGICRDFPGLQLHAVVGDFHRHLDVLPRGGRRLVAFLGGTIGNLTQRERKRFLFDLDCTMDGDDHLLLGADLVKDPARLVAAYDDAAGVTAEFNRNVLHVLNRELGATFEPERFEHVARWDPESRCIEMRLRAEVSHTVDLADLGLQIAFTAGEELRTEVSAKFTTDQVAAELWEGGFVVEQMWDEPGGDFLLVLARPCC